MVQRLSCVSLLRFKRNAVLPFATVADLVATRYPKRGIERINMDIEYMIDAGSRYENIDASAGQGACLFLGRSVAETSLV